MKHKIFYGAFKNTHLLALNAKLSVASSLAPNLQMSFTDVIFCKKMVQQKKAIMAKLVELGCMTILCSPKWGIICNMQNQVPK
ncbi:hypothetical protein [Cellvibrio fibrivorans]|uniref:Uncharacterized protein n=1 Tax=Cellvibrio fibrivorans TaxID=126350 RepID=A0ABU1UWN1_9GAMM|nr:hypothetical protein [Cellvibrio fibrivorans]MDR7089595.1 hypothetical protein [Cellvibrio fibrivorans]